MVDEVVAKLPHIESGTTYAQASTVQRVKFTTVYTSAPHVTISPVNNTSPRDYLRACTITTITTTYFEFVEVAIKFADMTKVNGIDQCEWVAYGV